MGASSRPRVIRAQVIVGDRQPLIVAAEQVVTAAAPEIRHETAATSGRPCGSFYGRRSGVGTIFKLLPARETFGEIGLDLRELLLQTLRLCGVAAI